jgi:hypothetical protein
MNEMRRENAIAENKIRDLEVQLNEIKDNAQTIQEQIQNSAQIDTLERSNRKLKSEVEYLEACQQKYHLCQEELIAKEAQTQRYEKKIINLELEKDQITAQLVQAKKDLETRVITSESEDNLRSIIMDLNGDVDKLRDKLTTTQDELKKEKIKLNERDESLEEIQQRLARLTSERNGYKRIVDLYENDNQKKNDKIQQKRIDELEAILEDYQKTLKDNNSEIKLRNNTSIQLNDNINSRSVECQVDLTNKIIENYENTIIELRSEIKKLKQHQQNDTIEAIIEDDKVESLSIIDADTFRRMENDLNDQKKMNERLVREYEKKALEVLRVFRQLIGFKINFLEDKTVKLTRIASRDDFLIFKV